MKNKHFKRIKEIESEINSLHNIACVCGDSNCYEEHKDEDIIRYLEIRKFNNNQNKYWIVQKQDKNFVANIFDTIPF